MYKSLFQSQSCRVFRKYSEKSALTCKFGINLKSKWRVFPIKYLKTSILVQKWYIPRQ